MNINGCIKNEILSYLMENYFNHKIFLKDYLFNINILYILKMN